MRELVARIEGELVLRPSEEQKSPFPLCQIGSPTDIVVGATPYSDVIRQNYLGAHDRAGKHPLRQILFVDHA